MKRFLPVFVLALLVAAPLGMTVAAPPPAPRAALSDNLVAWWSLDETSGTRSDSTGSYPLTDNNTVGYTSTGKIGNAANFQKSNYEYLSHGDADVFSSQSFSIGGWVRLNSKSSYQYLWSKYQTAQREWGVGYNNSTDRFEFYIEPSALSLVSANNFGSPTAKQWVFVVATLINQNQISITVNAGTANSLTVSSALVNRTWPLEIGCIADTSQFCLNGDIDESFFYSRALSMDEIATLYNSGAGCAYANLANNCAAATATPTNTNTPAHTNTPTPDFSSWPYPTAKSSSGFTENAGATLPALYQADGAVITYTEAAGASAQYVQFNYAAIPNTLTTLHWRVWGYYSGGHTVKAQCYSPALGWTSLTGNSTDMPTATATAFYEFAVPISDCVVSGSLQLRMYHVNNGVGTHVLVFDQAVLHGVSSATSTPTAPPGTATNTPTVTPTPTATFTPTPNGVYKISLPNGETAYLENRLTVGDFVIGAAMIVLALIFMARWARDAARRHS